jgi:hypothetical protein
VVASHCCFDFLIRAYFYVKDLAFCQYYSFLEMNQEANDLSDLEALACKVLALKASYYENEYEDCEPGSDETGNWVQARLDCIETVCAWAKRGIMVSKIPDASFFEQHKKIGFFEIDFGGWKRGYDLRFYVNGQGYAYREDAEYDTKLPDVNNPSYHGLFLFHQKMGLTSGEKSTLIELSQINAELESITHRILSISARLKDLESGIGMEVV